MKTSYVSLQVLRKEVGSIHFSNFQRSFKMERCFRWSTRVVGGVKDESVRIMRSKSGVVVFMSSSVVSGYSYPYIRDEVFTEVMVMTFVGQSFDNRQTLSYSSTRSTLTCMTKEVTLSEKCFFYTRLDLPYESQHHS